MKVSRVDILALLKKVEPALSAKDLIPVFACLCFDGTTVTAFDDVVALQYPINFGVVGAIRGRVLLDFLGASRAKEVEVVEAEEADQILIKAGRAKLLSPVLPPDDFLFKRPKMKNGDTLAVGEPFVKALSKAAISMGRDPSHPFRLGVTVATNSDPKPGLMFYSSDNKAASRVFWPTKVGNTVELTTVLPPRFCELLLEINRSDAVKSLTLAGEWAEATFESGLRLFSRTVEGGEASTFEKLFAQILKNKTGITIPKGLDKCLERALVVAKFAKEPFTSLRVKDDKLYLNTVSEGAGVIKDTISIETHGPVNVTVAPELMARALPMVDKMALIENSCVLFRGENFIHLITVVQQEEKEAE